MPSYPLTFPSLKPEHVDYELVAAQAISRSPTSYVPQVYDHGGRMFRITVKMQRMNKADATVFGAFLRDLDAMVGTFNFDMDPWCPGFSPAPGVRVFRKSGRSTAGSSDFGVSFDFSFTAEEDP